MSEPRPCQKCGKEIYFDGLCYECRTRQEKEHYLAMSVEKVQNTIEEIIAGIETIDEWDKVYKDFNGLLAYHNINTEKIAEAALNKNIFYPPELYRNASPTVRNQLIAFLNMPDCEDANHLQQCLAMCGGDVVIETFMKLEKSPLPWRKQLYVDPPVYAECGGWSYDDKGNRLELIFPECYAVLPAAARDAAVTLGTLREEKCAVCGCQTVDILTIDGHDKRLGFLGIKGIIRIPCCPNCAGMCEKTIVRYQLDGHSQYEMIQPFAEENYIDETALLEMSAKQLALTPQPVPPFYGRGVDEVITIGGMANWVQDWVYENCPDCGRKMRFLAQIPWVTLLEDSEGTLFIEICTECQTITMFHQQT